MCATFRSTVHLLLRVVGYFVRVLVAKCMNGGETVSRGVLVDVAVPWYKDNYQSRYFLNLHLIGHNHPYVSDVSSLVYPHHC